MRSVGPQPGRPLTLLGLCGLNDLESQRFGTLRPHCGGTFDIEGKEGSPEKPVACNSGQLSINYSLVGSMVACCCLGFLAFQAFWAPTWTPKVDKSQ